MAEATHGKFKYKEKKANFQCLVWQQSREAMIFYKHSLRRSCAKCLIIMRREFEISSSSPSHPVSIFSGNWKNSRHSAFNLIWKSCDDSSRGIQSRSSLYRAARKRSGLRRGFRGNAIPSPHDDDIERTRNRNTLLVEIKNSASRSDTGTPLREAPSRAMIDTSPETEQNKKCYLPVFPTYLNREETLFSVLVIIVFKLFSFSSRRDEDGGIKV